MKKVAMFLLALTFVLPASAKAATVAELQAQIASLSAQIQQLQAQLSQQTGSTSWCHNFNTDLQIGNSGSEVVALQTALEKEGLQIKGGWNPNIFDELTASAISSFQEKYRSEILTPAGLSSPTGYVGGRTRAKLNSLYKCVNNVYVPPTTPTPVACTTDAKLCSDGITYVSRISPSCQFAACPATTDKSSAPTISYINPTSVKAGVQVTIYGSNLYGNILVIDGEVAPSWQYNSTLDSSGNTMIFNAPSGVGSHNIQVEQKIIGGRSNSVKLNVEATLPTISYVTPSSAKVGDTITIYGTNLYGNGVVFDGNNLSSYVTNYGFPNTSGNIMTFTVPKNASVGSHTIQIEQKIIGGRSNSVSLDVVAQLQLPTISYVSPTSTGAGGQITIYGSNLYGNILVIDGEVAPSWQYNSTLDSSGNTMIFNAPSGVGSHNIQVEQKIIGGRSNTVTVNTNP